MKKGLNPRMYESWVDIMTIKTCTITLLQYSVALFCDSLDEYHLIWMKKLLTTAYFVLWLKNHSNFNRLVNFIRHIIYTG